MSKIKWQIFTGLMLFVISFGLLPCIRVNAYGSDSDVFISENTAESWIENYGTGDILLVYETGRGTDTDRQLEAMISVATALGKVVDFGLWDDVKDNAGDYEYIIFYDIQNPSPELLSLCGSKEINCLFLGTELVKKYLNSIKKNDLVLGTANNSKVIMSYELPGRITLQKQFANVNLIDIEEQSVSEYGVLQADGRDYFLSAKVEGISYIQLTDYLSEEAKAVLMTELARWMASDDSPKIYSQYIVIDEIYPFMPPQKLLDKVEFMKEQNMPYVLSVMPITDNTAYPAMKEFCEVLAYAQMNGAMIVLHAPIVHDNNVEVPELREQLAVMTRGYIQNGIYPVGIEVPERWTYDNTFLEILSWYSTVLVYEDEEDTGFLPEAGTNYFARQEHQSIFEVLKVDETGLSYVPYYSSAVYIPVGVDNDELESIVAGIRRSSQSVGALNRFSHIVWLNDGTVIFNDGSFTVDGVKRDLVYAPYEFEEEYDYKQNVFERISLSLEKQNKYLLWGTVAAILIFATFILLTRIQSRKSFFYAAGSRDNADETYEKTDNEQDAVSDAAQSESTRKK